MQQCRTSPTNLVAIQNSRTGNSVHLSTRTAPQATALRHAGQMPSSVISALLETRTGGSITFLLIKAVTIWPTTFQAVGERMHSSAVRYRSQHTRRVAFPHGRSLCFGQARRRRAEESCCQGNWRHVIGSGRSLFQPCGCP